LAIDGWVTNGTVAWLPRSPNLTLLDFFSVGTFEECSVFNSTFYVQDLRNKIVNACAELTKEQILAANQREVIRQSYMENDGLNFEQFVRKLLDIFYLNK
jgi:hypothetical protein